MTINKTIQLRDDIHRLYVLKEIERGLPSTEDSVDASIQELEDDMENSKELRIRLVIYWMGNISIVFWLVNATSSNNKTNHDICGK